MLRSTIIVIAFLIFYFIDEHTVDAVCCAQKGGWGAGGGCADGSNPGDFQCCGRRACNFFCCNCDGGCKSGGWNRDVRVPDWLILGLRRASTGATAGLRPGRRRRSTDEATAGHNIIALADQDGDGKMNMSEAHAWLSGNNGPLTTDLYRELMEMDKNEDGFLARYEIDE